MLAARALRSRARAASGRPAAPHPARAARRLRRPLCSAAPQDPDKYKATYADQVDTWVDRHAPAGLRPYLKLARADRPIGSQLLFLPGAMGIALAAPAGALPDAGLLALFGAGAVLMRGAGCTVNDLWDRDFDRRVARTRERPLAAGTVSPARAVAFMGAQLTGALGVLVTMNAFTIKLCAASLSLVAAYPLAKRVTYWPQAVLGLAMNYGALAGWAAVQGGLDWAAVLPLYGGCWAWTMVYDTLYAHQDVDDDRHVGVKSTALLFGERSKPILTGFAAAAVAGWALAGASQGLAWPFYAGVGAAGGHMLWQIHSARLTDRLNLTARFVSNKWTGAMVLGGIVAGNCML